MGFEKSSVAGLELSVVSSWAGVSDEAAAVGECCSSMNLAAAILDALDVDVFVVLALGDSIARSASLSVLSKCNVSFGAHSG